MSDVVIFPVGKEVEASAYLAWCTTKYQEASGLLFDWYPSDRIDIYSQRVVGYLGPTGFVWNNQPFPEPSGGPAMREDGVLASTVTFMPIEQ